MKRVHDAFSFAMDLNSFSSKLEEVHGWIHWAFGGGDTRAGIGHMWPSEYSGFDPVFMLHHRYVQVYVYFANLPLPSFPIAIAILTSSIKQERYVCSNWQTPLTS
jgi:hypothetical protein